MTMHHETFEENLGHSPACGTCPPVRAKGQGHFNKVQYHEDDALTRSEVMEARK